MVRPFPLGSHSQSGSRSAAVLSGRGTGMGGTGIEFVLRAGDDTAATHPRIHSSGASRAYPQPASNLETLAPRRFRGSWRIYGICHQSQPGTADGGRA